MPAQSAVASHPLPPLLSLSPTLTEGNEDRLEVHIGLSARSSLVMLPLRRETCLGLATPSPPRAAVTPSRSTAPSAAPVQIPTRPKSRDAAHPQKPRRHHGERRHHPASRRPRDVHSPDAIPASVAALLAITNIPPPSVTQSVRQAKAEKRMTVESIIERAQESEKKLSLKLSKGPLDILLAAPEDLETNLFVASESPPGSILSTRALSLESVPSLSNSFTTDTLSSIDTPHTPVRRRKTQPTRRSLEPVSSPPGERESHPLSAPEIDVEQLDFRVFGSKEDLPDKKASRLPFKPLKSAFKSNLTASLRALRHAARSFSNLNFSSIPPEDFLTRSILTIDPQVPYTDERRPPLEEVPTAAVRRYLNPTTTARLEKPQAIATGPALRTFTASIQMQTYKVQRARSATATSGNRSPYPSVGPSSQTPQAAPQAKPAVTEYSMPGPRQREMRENPDFIRIAVMEMAMRKSGKLDDQRPGRARWALPPRKPSAKPYDIGADGVPARWVAVTHG